MAVLALTVVLQLVMEYTNHADSLGWWYTLYSAVIYAIPIYLLLKVILILRNRLRREKSVRNGE